MPPKNPGPGRSWLLLTAPEPCKGPFLSALILKTPATLSRKLLQVRKVSRRSAFHIICRRSWYFPVPSDSLLSQKFPFPGAAPPPDKSRTQKKEEDFASSPSLKAGIRLSGNRTPEPHVPEAGPA